MCKKDEKMNIDLLDKLKEARKRASNEEWRAVIDGVGGVQPNVTYISGYNDICDMYFRGISGEHEDKIQPFNNAASNAEYIALSHNSLPTLIQALRDAREGLEFYGDKTIYRLCFDELDIYDDSGKKAQETLTKLDKLLGVEG